jgi:ketosteroid isomerase-like protein
MTESDTLDFADKFFNATFAGDPVAARRFYAPDAVIWHNTNRLELNVDQNMEIITWIAKLIPDQRCHVVRREVTRDGFFQQDLLEATLPDGSAFSQTSCVVVRMKDGLIVRLDEYLDSVEFEPLKALRLQLAEG